MKCRLANSREAVRVALREMRLLFPLLGHLLVTLARLARPGGVRSMVAESLAVKHQLASTPDTISFEDLTAHGCFAPDAFVHQRRESEVWP